MNNTQPNLDRLAARHAQEIIRRTVEEKNAEAGKKDAGKVDNTVTKALGVLQEDGVYACFLYLLAKEGDLGKVVVDELLNLLQGLGFKWNKPMKNGQPDLSAEAVLKHITENVTADLERLLLAKETLATGMLHEVEFLAPNTLDTGEPVCLIGYVFERDGCELAWQTACAKLQLGGERGYGWGNVELVRVSQPENKDLFMGKPPLMT